jgi:hypothetical protein
VEAEPEAGLQLEVGGDAAAAEAAVLVGADLQPPPAAGELDGVDAAAGVAAASRTTTSSPALAR